MVEETSIYPCVVGKCMIFPVPNIFGWGVEFAAPCNRKGFDRLLTVRERWVYHPQRIGRFSAYENGQLSAKTA